jgi:hypothetical protein
MLGVPDRIDQGIGRGTGVGVGVHDFQGLRTWAHWESMAQDA